MKSSHPCECWAIASPTRGRKFAKTYDIILHVTGRRRAQDRMTWIGVGGRRDCCVLQTYRLCCTWFDPLHNRDCMDFHARAFAVSATYETLPVAPHVPMAHAFARQQVQGNQGQCLDVDYILIHFVGPSMKHWLMSVDHQWTAASPDLLRESFLSLVVLCHRSHQSKLSWHQELFSRPLCYDVVRRRWFWVDADILEEQREQIPFTRACYKAAHLLAEDLQGYRSGEADAHGVFVQ